MQETEFKPVFLYRNEEAIKNQKKLHDEWLVYIQNGIDEAKKLFDESLTDEELIEIMQGGWKSVENLMRVKSQFLNAKIETLLDLKGVDGTLAKTSLTHVVNRSKAIKASIVDGNVIIGEEALSDFQDKHSYYTRSLTQNELLDDAKRLSDLLNKLIQENILNNLDIHQTCSRLKIVKSDRNGAGEFSVIPNFKSILEV